MFALVEPKYAQLLEAVKGDVRADLWDALESPKPIYLRDYQKEANANIHRDWGKGLSTIAHMATGTGKTETFLAALAHDPTLTRALIIAHRQELIYQPVTRILKSWRDLPMPGVVMADTYMPDAPIIVATVQTLTANASRLDEILSYGAFSHLVIDECHHATSRTYLQVIDALKVVNPHLRILGVTATPLRTDGTALKKVFQSKAYQITILEAIKRGALVPMVPVIAEMPVSLSGVRSNVDGWDDEAVGDLYSTDEALSAAVSGWIRAAWRDSGVMINACANEAWQPSESDLDGASRLNWSTHRQTIIFTASVKQAHKLAEAFNQQGIHASAVDGTTPRAQRFDILSKYKCGDIRVICNCAVLTEGFDAPVTSCVVNARPTKSGLILAQQYGRGLRLAPNKSECLVIDCAPTGNPDIVMAGDILSGQKSREQSKKEAKARQLGIILDVFGLKDEDLGVDADPQRVVMRLVDLFSSRMKKYALTFDGGVASLSLDKGLSLAIVAPQTERIKKADQLKATGTWRDEWEAEYRNISRYHLYQIRDRQLIYLESADNEIDIARIAEAFADENGKSWAMKRKSKFKSDPAKAGTEQFARRLGVWRDNMTQGEASGAITHFLAARALKQAGVIR